MPPKKQSEMTKKERRELQEEQRRKKAELRAAAQQHPSNKGKKQAKQQQQQPQSGSQGASGSGSSGQPTSTVNRQSPQSIVDPRILLPKDQIKKKQLSLQRIPAQKPVSLFSHLPQFERPSNLTLTNPNVHPTVISLGLKFAEFIISGGNARCIAMLQTFQQVIKDYRTPTGTSLQRHLTQHISKQIDYLSSCRSLSASMKSAIRSLKYQINILNIDIPDADAKVALCDEIDSYIATKIKFADQEIVNNSIENIHDGDVILTYSKSSVILAIFQNARDRGVDFRVVVCDSRPKLEGKELIKRLVASGIQCTYILTSGLGVVMKEVTKVMLGSSALFSNGAIMSRCGTSVVAMMAHEYQIPVIFACEAYKFSDTVRLDSVVWNEIGDSNELVDTSNAEPTSRLPHVVPKYKTLVPDNVNMEKWRDMEHFGVLNLHYDVTPAHLISMIISEVGIIASTSASFLRENDIRD